MYCSRLRGFTTAGDVTAAPDGPYAALAGAGNVNGSVTDDSKRVAETKIVEMGDMFLVVVVAAAVVMVVIDLRRGMVNFFVDVDSPSEVGKNRRARVKINRVCVNCMLGKYW